MVVLRSQNYTKDALNIDVLATIERQRVPRLGHATADSHPGVCIDRLGF